MSKTDQRVLDLIAKLNEKKAQISGAERPSWKTSCSLPSTVGSTKVTDRVNIQTVTDLGVLTSLYGEIITREQNWKLAGHILGTTDSFTWGGYSLEDWTHDFKIRANQINIAKTRAEYKVLEERLDRIISPELRAELELAELEKQLQ